MKKLTFFLLLLCSVITVKAQDWYDWYDDNEKNHLTLNNAIALGVGLSHLHTPLTGDEYMRNMSTKLISFDLRAACAYLGLAFGVNKTHTGNYDLDEMVHSFIWRLGPSFRYGRKGNNLSVTPFIGGLSCHFTLNDNGEDVTLPTSQRGYTFLYGIKLAYTCKWLEWSLHLSNHDVGVTAAFIWDF